MRTLIILVAASACFLAMSQNLRSEEPSTTEVETMGNVETVGNVEAVTEVDAASVRDQDATLETDAEGRNLGHKSHDGYGYGQDPAVYNIIVETPVEERNGPDPFLLLALQQQRNQSPTPIELIGYAAVLNLIQQRRAY